MVKKILLSLALLFVGIPTAAITYILIGPGGVYKAANRGKDSVVVVEKGYKLEDIANLVVEQKLVNNKAIFYTAAFIGRSWGSLKAGEFLIPEHARPIDIIMILCCGRVIVHSITFHEGITIAEVIEKLYATPNLKGGIEYIPVEGFLLPETYSYVYGETRQSIIDRMQAAMTQVISKEWLMRQKDLPYKTPEDALTMASIIEKETGRAAERARIAAVFVNRMRLGMKLQSDPTVIYGITRGKTKLGRSITKSDLKSETVYNTYLIGGMPPHPIACPGAAAIKAALNPAKSNDLFFVANGMGGHNFSRTYAQHTSYVANWRQIERKK